MKKNLNLTPTSQDALIVTDIQLDFLPGGALPVAEGDLLVPVINDYVRIFEKAKSKVIASRDWHPANHMSFTAQGGPWPSHCVQDSDGAKFHPDLKLPKDVLVVSKATDPAKEAYSVFDGTGLAETLRSLGVTRLFFCGLATDYCVVNSVLDARRLGLDTFVLVDATRGINVKPGDVERALDAMVKNGAVLVSLADFPEPEVLVGDESPVEVAGDRPLLKVETKKKARMRPKGSYKRVRRERG
ncbi:MAG: nicotinamidase [Candidatus Bathyarchaeia archaeon]